jgi:predicted transcriptional regulator
MKHGSPTASPEAMVALTSRITAGYLRGNALPAADIASVISTVHGSLLLLRQPAPAPPQQQAQKPAVPIRRSVTAESIVCPVPGQIRQWRRSVTLRASHIQPKS